MARKRQRPKTRADCANMQRPCPWVSCRFHLALSVNEGNGSIHLEGGRTLSSKVSSSAVERFTEWVSDVVVSMQQTCALDVADAGPRTLQEVGDLLGVTRENIRLIERRAMLRMAARMRRYGSGG